MAEGDGSRAGEDRGADAASSGRRWGEVRWLLPLLLTPLLLAGCWAAPFFDLDDRDFIRDNRLLDPATPWTEAFTKTEVDNLYIPLTWVSFRVDRAVYGTLLGDWLDERAWPTGIRTTNLLLHLGAALWLWVLLTRLGLRPGVAGLVVAAFAVHPVVVPSVAWPIERKNTLAAFWGFGALALYISARSWRGYLASLGFYALALLSKPVAVGLLPVVAAWEVLGRPGGEAPAEERRAGFAAWGPQAAWLAGWVLLSAAISGVAMSVSRRVLLPPIGGTLGTALLTDFLILWRYVGNLLLPAGLSHDYGFAPIRSLGDARLWGAALCLALFAGATLGLTAGRERRWVLWGWLWFLGALVPALNLVGWTNLMTDIYVYLAAPGLWLAVGVAADAAWRRAGRPGSGVLPHLGGVLLIALCVLWGALSVQRSHLYADAPAVYADAVAKQPESATMQLLLAEALKKQAADADPQVRERLWREHLQHLEACEASPLFDRMLVRSRVHMALGRAYLEQGRLAEAEAQARAGLASPYGVSAEDYSTGQQVLGSAALRRAPEEALRCFDEALRATPKVRSIHILRAKALVAMQDRAELAGDQDRARELHRAAREALGKIPSGAPAYAEAQWLLKAIQPPGGPAPDRPRAAPPKAP